jgi:hypothetical protein
MIEMMSPSHIVTPIQYTKEMRTFEIFIEIFEILKKKKKN